MPEYVCIASLPMVLYAFSPSGSVQWRKELPGGMGAIVCTPAIAPDGTIYATSSTTIYAISPDGATKWTYYVDPYGTFMDAPAVANDGTLYVGGGDCLMKAFSPNGILKWTFACPGTIECSPIDRSNLLPVGGIPRYSPVCVFGR